MTQPMDTQTSDRVSKRTLDTPTDAIAREPSAKKTKTTTDPNQPPKRANSAFILFSQAERANLKRDRPDASNTELFKQLGERWREADADTKARYEAMYQANKAKVDDERRVYASTVDQAASNGAPVASSSKSPGEAKSKKKAPTDPNAPKRANSAFILFSQAERANIKRENPEATNAELFKRLGEKWREADADTKARFEALYKANKATADEEMAKYASTLGPVESTASSAKSPGASETRAKKAPSDPNAPKRGGSAFILFSQAERANIKRENPSATNAELFKRLGEKWREADADTKAKYEATYQANKARAAAGGVVEDKVEAVVASAPAPTPAPTPAPAPAPAPARIPAIAVTSSLPEVASKAKSQPKARKSKTLTVCTSEITVV